MDINELLDFLGMDLPEEFKYFEQMADLVECDEHIPYDAFFNVLSEVPPETLIEITENYFEDIQSGLPEDSVDVYTLLDTIKQALLGLAQNVSEESARTMYVDELFRFRTWYHLDSVVTCKGLDTQAIKEITISEALVLSRLEKLGEESYSYDFSQCFDFEINEYALSFSTVINMEHEEADEIDEDEDDELYGQGLIDRENPVIDGEDYEEDYLN